MQAGSYASRPWPLETILVSILLEQEKELADLRAELATLKEERGQPLNEVGQVAGTVNHPMDLDGFPSKEIKYEVGFDDQYPIPEGPQFLVSGYSPKKGWDSRCWIDRSNWSRKAAAFAGLSEAIQSKMAVKSSTATGR